MFILVYMITIFEYLIVLGWNSWAAFEHNRYNRIDK